MNSISRRLGSIFVLTCTLTSVALAKATPFKSMETKKDKIFRLIEKHCFECHSGKEAEAEFDLESWKDVKAVSQDIEGLKKFESMVRSGQMPPKDSNRLSEADKSALTDWSNSLLLAEARKFAGDPGPTLLRRLSNAEYNYSIRDLTGLPTLDLTKEFPIDGAAGEGFTNTGSGQAMSPALMQKYFDAAKKVSQHAVLLPEGIRFSVHTTERDRIDDCLDRIRSLYKKHTENVGSRSVSYQGYRFESNGGGRLPLHAYLQATVAFREKQKLTPKNRLSIDQFARQQNLSPKYLKILWAALNANESDSLLLDLVRKQWRKTDIESTNQLASAIAVCQSRLWKFNSIGHIGRESGPEQWLQPINPESTRRSFRIPIRRNSDSKQTLYLGAKSLKSSLENIRWYRPRLTDVNKNTILLRDLSSLTRNRVAIQKSMLTQAGKTLEAIRELRLEIHRQKDKLLTQELIGTIAKRFEIEPNRLMSWIRFLGYRTSQQPRVSGHFQIQMKSASGYQFVRGWGTGETPSVLANSSDQQVRIPGIMLPRSVVVHPSPSLFSACTWQSPVDGDVTVNADISDQHPECGNGVEWLLKHEGRSRKITLWKGEIGTAKKAVMKTKSLRVQKGDLISFVVGPRAKSHACDLTRINLRIKSAKIKKNWDLAIRLSDHILESNPLDDKYDNPGVWHFHKGSWSKQIDPANASKVPSGSMLDLWLQTSSETEQIRLEKEFVRLVENPSLVKNEKDKLLLNRILTLVDPVFSNSLRNGMEPDNRFVRTHDNEGTAKIPNTDLITETGKVTAFQIPSEWFEGGYFEVECEILGNKTSKPVQVFAQFAKPQLDNTYIDTPITVFDTDESIDRLFTAFDRFRQLFPAAVCYEKIVPVDEVVTLTLFHRDDSRLRDLFLSDQDIQTLNRLWDELNFVSKEPLKKIIALEQIYQFATQDRPDLVKEFKKLFEPTAKRAEVFRKKQAKANHSHLEDARHFAERAWRRPLNTRDSDRLTRFYEWLLAKDISHEQAIQLLLSRILVSPDFLFRREEIQNGTGYSKINSSELATRLSYFLWSSTPDPKLAQVAKTGKLTTNSQLTNQVQRMLKDPKSDRLAIQFACQWLHLKDFDKNDDKNEKLFPQFEVIRSDMYQETVNYIKFIFRNNRSILEFVESDFVFANARLAEHYGLSDRYQQALEKRGPNKNGWVRIERLNTKERGGILAMATFLASQSGASRTSPILRGTWVSETLLGERLPKPPADVPQLPETLPSGLTARQLIEKHSSLPACAKCHRRIDPYGFALEQFDALGRIRPQKVNTSTILIDGKRIDGLEGLKSYILKKRRDDFVRQFCKKLLGFALGRETQLSDEPLILEMIKELKANQFRFQSAILTIVQSDQFLNVRDASYQR